MTLLKFFIVCFVIQSTGLRSEKDNKENVTLTLNTHFITIQTKHDLSLTLKCFSGLNPTCVKLTQESQKIHYITTLLFCIAKFAIQMLEW